LVMQDNYRRWIGEVLCTQRHHEVTDVFHHSANDDVVFC
jgi:hypothetical protein